MKRISGGIAWNSEWRGRDDRPVLALIHGFAGSLHSWDDLAPHLDARFRLVLIDLPGHGGTMVPASVMSLHDLGTALGELLIAEAKRPVILCGYSMGGRAALHTALFFPQAVSALVLLGASPGIEDVHERKERRQNDHKLAGNILENGMEWFADYWGALPLFASQKKLPPDVQDKLRTSRMSCDPHGLAYCLRNFGTGEQEFLGRELYRLTCPTLLMAGALDEKFARSNQYMLSAIGSDNAHAVEIPAAGHAAHIENPQTVAREIISFAENIRTKT